LIAELLADGYRSIEAIDISAAAIDQLADHLGDRQELITSRVADVRSVEFSEPVEVWHDRAVFHFLTSPEDRRAYAGRAAASVRIGGHIVIAAFALDGPEQCSGLPVTRHSAESLAECFAGSFVVIDSFERDHVTPWGASQRFVHAVLERVGPFRRRGESD
jgi:hypothetical protein